MRLEGWGRACVGLACLLALACTPGPAATVERLQSAAQQNDRRRVWELLGPATRAALRARAAQAELLAGGGRVVAPEELLSLSVGRPADGAKPVSLRRRQRDQAVVEVGDSSEAPVELTCVRTRRGWNVELVPVGR